MKRDAFSFADLIDGAAGELQCAAATAWEARLREVESVRAMALLAERQLRERGVACAPVDWARYTAAGGRELLLCSKPERFARQIRELASRVRAHTDLLPQVFAAHPARTRRGEPRRKERLNLGATAERLMALAIEYDIGPAGMPIERMAHEHLHLVGTPSESCPVQPCPRLAICRCVFDVVDAIGSPIKLAVGQLTDVEFDTAAWLDGIQGRITSALHEAGRDCRDSVRELPPLLTELSAVAGELRALECETRSALLSAPRDLAPRGRRTKDALLVSIILHLHRAGCPVDVISMVIVDESVRDGAAPSEGIQKLLKRYKAKHWAWRTRHSSTPEA